MKVLFIGPYKDGTGWGNAAIEYILALDAADIDVVPRAITLNHKNLVHPKIRELEQKSDKNCDVVIQNILPHMFDYNGNFDKNIGLIFTETSHFNNTDWTSYINSMDELWVGCSQSVDCCRESHISIPVNVVPVPCDVGKYTKYYSKYPIPEIQDKFVFYFIGEYTRRKNLAALIKAFLVEFNKYEDVSLVIKTHVSGMSPAECNRQVLQMVEEIKTQLKLSDMHYPGIVIITQDLAEEEVMQLHATCDCFVMPSFGEGWNIPCQNSMGMGKTPICTNIGGMADFVHDAGWLIDAHPTPCFGMQPWAGHDKLYLGNELWYDIDVPMLCAAMREAYTNVELRKTKAMAGINKAYEYTHEVIGGKMKELLNK